MTDARWALLEPLLPERAPRRGGRWAEHRAVVDAICWRTRTGAPWRDVPAAYRCWQTIYGRHRRWCADGAWAGVLDPLRAGGDHDRIALDVGGAWVLSVDSTVVRAHTDAAGARHASRAQPRCGSRPARRAGQRGGSRHSAGRTHPPHPPRWP